MYCLNSACGWQLISLSHSLRHRGRGEHLTSTTCYAFSNNSSNLWQSTVDKDLPDLIEHIKSAWANRESDQTYMRILLAVNQNLPPDKSEQECHAAILGYPGRTKSRGVTPGRDWFVYHVQRLRLALVLQCSRFHIPMLLCLYPCSLPEPVRHHLLLWIGDRAGLPRGITPHRSQFREELFW